MTTPRPFAPAPLLAATLLGLSLAAPRAAAQVPAVPPVPVPPQNPITEAKRVLGKILFWDEQLSSDDTVACGTCHIPSVGGTDPRQGLHPGADGLFGTPDDVSASPGMIRSDDDNRYLPDPFFDLTPQVTGRAAPSFFDMTQYAPELFWDGRAGSQFVDPQTGEVLIPVGGALESQAVAPILSSTEMGHDGRGWDEVLDKLAQVTPLRLASDLPPDMAAALAGGQDYPDLFAAAFGDPQISAARIGLALATYERTLVPDQTPFDAFLAGQPGALTPGQQAGWNFLQNQSLCLNCHTPPLFTDFQYHNLGLRPAGEDLGREEVTGNPADRGAFKTPSLRNVGLKQQLMHVGWIADVPDALGFYNAPAFPQTGPNGHTQFTADQSLIPNPPFPPLPYTANNVPPQVLPAVIDFLENALTDPRVAAESFPFDRPTLHGQPAIDDPLVQGAAHPGSGGLTPRVIARTPASRGSPDFKLGLDRALGGTVALLGLSLGTTPPGTLLKGAVPFHLDPNGLLAILPIPVAGGAGAGQGHATVLAPLPDDPAAAGLALWGQWFVPDPAAVAGLAASRGARWIMN